MTFKDFHKEAGAYSRFARTVHFSDTLPYAAMGLAGSAGDVARLSQRTLSLPEGCTPLAQRTAIASALGRVLWWAAAVSLELGLDLDAIAEQHLDDLASDGADAEMAGMGSR